MTAPDQTALAEAVADALIRRGVVHQCYFSDDDRSDLRAFCAAWRDIRVQGRRAVAGFMIAIIIGVFVAGVRVFFRP